MNKLIFLLTGSFIALLLATSCNDKRAVDVGVRTKMDSISYCIGIVYGQNLHGDGFDTINPWVIARAFDDLFDEKDLVIEKNKAKDILLEHYAKVKRGQLLAEFEDVKLEGEKFLEENAKNENVTSLPSGLQYSVIKEGTGPKPKPDDVVGVYYQGWLLNGTKFDTHTDGDPVIFGVNRVIPGWTEALQLMNTGSKWKLFIPYNLAYGTEFRPNSTIVPYSTLIFELELAKIESNQGN